MPLGFRSLSHGDIAFGFFNVKSDMLLLENYFFFADDFCKQITALENSCEEDLSFQWNVWHIPNRSDMGDFRSFLGEKRDIGFWGELYRHYPYPERPEEFHQQPEGWQTQPEVARIIGNYGAQKEIAFDVDPDREMVSIGEYCFSYHVFKEFLYGLVFSKLSPLLSSGLLISVVLHRIRNVLLWGSGMTRFSHGDCMAGISPILAAQKHDYLAGWRTVPGRK